MAEENEFEAVAVTGRPNDIPVDAPKPAPLGGNTTFADRAKASRQTRKAVTDDSDAENKSVTAASTKATARKSSK